jgi:hypothetical protein
MKNKTHDFFQLDLAMLPHCANMDLDYKTFKELNEK